MDCSSGKALANSWHIGPCGKSIFSQLFVLIKSDKLYQIITVFARQKEYNTWRTGTRWYRPVEIPQLSKQALSTGSCGLILTTWATSTTVYSEKLETYKKWCTTSPFMSLNLLLPSLGISIGNFLLNTEQALLFLDWQSLHSLQLGKNTGTTLSPSFTSSTCSPTLSTTL